MRSKCRARVDADAEMAAAPYPVKQNGRNRPKTGRPTASYRELDRRSLADSSASNTSEDIPALGIQMKRLTTNRPTGRMTKLSYIQTAENTLHGRNWVFLPDLTVIPSSSTCTSEVFPPLAARASARETPKSHPLSSAIIIASMVAGTPSGARPGPNRAIIQIIVAITQAIAPREKTPNPVRHFLIQNARPARRAISGDAVTMHVGKRQPQHDARTPIQL